MGLLLLGLDAAAETAPVSSPSPVASTPATVPTAPPPSTAGHTAPRTDGYSEGAGPAVSASAPAPPPPPSALPPPAAGAGTDTHTGAGDEPPRDARYRDAHHDRVILMSTAETHPAGTVYLSDYDLALLQAGYAVTDRVQITLTGTPPLGKDAVFPIDLSLKAVLVRQPRVRVAAIGAISGLLGLEEGNFLLGRIGGVAQLCLSDGCASSLNLGTSVLLAGPATLMTNGVGATWRLADFFSLLVEADALIPLSAEAGSFNGFALGGGVRFSWQRFGLDLAALAPVRSKVDDEKPPPVLPVLALTYRFL